MRGHAGFVIAVAVLVVGLGGGLLYVSVPLGLAEMVIGALVGLVAIGLYIWGKASPPEDQTTPSAEHPKMQVPSGEQPKTTRTLPDGRIVLPMTVEELTRPFKEYTQIRATPMVQDYIGKWVEAQGLISDIGPRGTESVSVTFDKLGYPKFLIEFSDPKLVEQLRVTPRGTSIRMRGKIANIGQHWVDLEECELLDLGGRRWAGDQVGVSNLRGRDRRAVVGEEAG